MATDTTVTMCPGSQAHPKRVRWHPNLDGNLLCPFEDYKEARLAQVRFPEILRRDEYQLKVQLRPEDYYIWDNFKVLHGREKVLSEPRTGVEQTVPEQVVKDRYKALCMRMLARKIGEEWLVHMPLGQLRELAELMQGEYCSVKEQ
ncbi:MAG: hypothetical protein MMC23_000539 [Stictis urceolatum]|nr:hypothetical protein [Stictis urceolata]